MKSRDTEVQGLVELRAADTKESTATSERRAFRRPELQQKGTLQAMTGERHFSF